MPFDELSKNKRFQAHCANVIGTLSGVIDHIHDPELTEASLLTLAERHKNRGQTQQQFQVNKFLLSESFFIFITIATYVKVDNN